MRRATFGLRLFTVIIFCAFSNFTFAQNDTVIDFTAGFRTWLDGLKQEALAEGITQATVTATINHITFIPEVIKLDRAQPEFISPFFDYYHHRVDASKIARGRLLLANHAPLLNQLQAKYGIPPSLLIAFWGMETNYGRFQGDIDTLSSLATLAYDGRRATFFRNQLLDAMRLIDEENANIDELHGSWAGAFGHMQFMPSTLVAFALDGDGDSKVDIVNSEADALASAANYLYQAGWRVNEPAMLEVHLPEHFQWQTAQLILRKSIADWIKLGVTIPQEIVSGENIRLPAAIKAKPSTNRKSKDHFKRKDFKSISDPSTFQSSMSPSPNIKKIVFNTQFPDVEGQAAILLPQGWHGPAFMVFDNFDVMLDWNHSVNYALSVAQLAKRINDEPPILGGQFAEAGGLTFEEMFKLQTMLNMQGFDCGEPDGFPGLQTQAAIRAYQLSVDLPADGYAGPRLLEVLLQTENANKIGNTQQQIKPN